MGRNEKITRLKIVSLCSSDRPTSTIDRTLAEDQWDAKELDQNPIREQNNPEDRVLLDRGELFIRGVPDSSNRLTRGL